MVIYFFLSAFNFAVMWAEWTEPRTEPVLGQRPLVGPSPKCWTEELKFLYYLWLDRRIDRAQAEPIAAMDLIFCLFI